ncbi:hypothetical protein EVAR_12832_1 [Eumeta japonica]|uniref:Uncharacterized protein n=1 Tax=Eumeta variegata TaxID=151549 RepID=A0A4C1UB46_EUMVA|nr:hypothetical protein EVAR_12832_1 [Eumeta japonica]
METNGRLLQSTFVGAETKIHDTARDALAVCATESSDNRFTLRSQRKFNLTLARGSQLFLDLSLPLNASAQHASDHSI